MKLGNLFFKLAAVSLSFMIMGSAHAQEITAIDFNGDLLGKVIPDGKVVSFKNQLIGNVTADSLIVDSKGELIGGVVPQGIAIGNDNKLLGKVNSDGSIRLSSGKIIGKVLPNGLVVDNYFEVIGAVLFPGLIYSDEGETIGRLSGDGVYTNLQGQPIGFISPDGFAYRKVGGDSILEGKLISSKMVVSNGGEFVGSVTPGGKVTDFDANVIGSIKANGFVFDDNNRVVGKTVKSGYAFDKFGKYIGFVTYNGEVISKDQLVGHLTSEGSIISDKGDVIGFPVDISATATDLNGKYLGRIMPKGVIAKARENVGRIGPRGVVLDNDSNVIGQLVKSGPAFDYKGTLKVHALKNGGAISLEGTPLGHVKYNKVYDNNGKIIAASLNDVIVLDNQNNYVGVSGINASIKNGEEYKYVSPFGNVFAADGQVIGTALKMGPVYNLAGVFLNSISANGELLNKGIPAVGKLTQSGINLDERNRILGKAVSINYAVDDLGNSSGIIAADNLVFDRGGKVIAKILPDGALIKDTSNTSTSLTPKIGQALKDELAISFDGRLAGITDASGVVKDLGGSIIGKVAPNSNVIDTTGSIIGTTIGYDSVVNDKCELIGVISSNGEVRNYREINMGRPLNNGQIINDADKVIGRSIKKAGVVDFNGNIIGVVSQNGKVINYAGENLGCVSKRGMLKNTKGAVFGGVVETYAAVDFMGNIIGRSTIDGTVIGSGDQQMGYVQPNGNINSKTGTPVGALLKYAIAFGNDNKYLGRVIEDGRVVDAQNKELGKVDFGGYVNSGEQKIGYALYDAYVYDDSFNAIGYIAADGNVMSFSNANIGRIDRGFLLDKSRRLIGRGNRDFYIRDTGYQVLGELQLDGKVIDNEGTVVGTLENDGSIVNASGIGIATAKPLQYYNTVAERPRVYNEEGKLIGFVTSDDTVVNDSGKAIGILKEDGTVTDASGNIIGGVGVDWYEKVEKLDVIDKDRSGKLPEVGVQEPSGKARKSFHIALTPDGEFLGEILDDGRVVDDKGKVIGHKMPDGLIMDDDGTLIGIEEVKKPDSDGMFVPAGTFGSGGAYGTGSGPGANLGPGGGYGTGERYDPQRVAALSAAQQYRRGNIAVGKISSGVRKETFDGMQDDWEEQGITKIISSWRVDMSEMILADKPIPAVIARSIDSNNPTPITAFVERNVYAEEGRNILIPAGSRLIGELANFGGANDPTSYSAKVQINWSRLIRPDGSMFALGTSITGDAQGRGGALGYLDQQLFKRYTMPIMTTAITSYTSYLIASSDTSNSDTETSKQQAANDARQNFLTEMNRIFERIMDDKTNIRPLTYVPAGTRIIVYPNADLWLRTVERDIASTNKSKYSDVLIDDKARQEGKDKEGPSGGTRSVSSDGSGGVVYEPDNGEEPMPLIRDRSSGNQQSSGATPPPPPPSYSVPASTPSAPARSSSGSSSSSSSSSSSKQDDSVPHLF